MDTTQKKNKNFSFLDIVVCGPDMSGTSTQINDMINYFVSKKMKIRDIRGTEMDLLFHAEMFKEYNKDFISLKAFLDSDKFNKEDKSKLLLEIYSLISGYKKETDLLVGSFKKNKITTYINPNSADVWVSEEPTKRGAGQVNRVIEQNRSSYDFESTGFSTIDGYSAALVHQAYRIDEFYRIRKILRDNNKIIIRSRSEESACYQIYDEKNNVNGIKIEEYIALPGHKVAFRFPPTHLFVVCGPENWDKESYLNLKTIRSNGRILDDYELNSDYQLMVNQRYASDWLNQFYKRGCNSNNAEYCPEIFRFSIFDLKEDIKAKMYQELDNLYSLWSKKSSI
ncbi:MAG: hypothetical protein WCX82_00355 [archaeon]|jgi:hypothetical protein